MRKYPHKIATFWEQCCWELLHRKSKLQCTNLIYMINEIQIFQR